MRNKNFRESCIVDPDTSTGINYRIIDTINKKFICMEVRHYIFETVLDVVWDATRLSVYNSIRDYCKFKHNYD
jgi:hypothetical protein